MRKIFCFLLLIFAFCGCVGPAGQVPESTPNLQENQLKYEQEQGAKEIQADKRKRALELNQK